MAKRDFDGQLKRREAKSGIKMSPIQTSTISFDPSIIPFELWSKIAYYLINIHIFECCEFWLCHFRTICKYLCQAFDPKILLKNFGLAKILNDKEISNDTPGQIYTKILACRSVSLLAPTEVRLFQLLERLISDKPDLVKQLFIGGKLHKLCVEVQDFIYNENGIDYEEMNLMTADSQDDSSVFLFFFEPDNTPKGRVYNSFVRIKHSTKDKAIGWSLSAPFYGRYDYQQTVVNLFVSFNSNQPCSWPLGSTMKYERFLNWTKYRDAVNCHWNQM